MSTNKKTYVICYDISNTRLRTRIDKFLKDYGVRIQFSIYECVIPKEIFTDKVCPGIKKIIKCSDFEEVSDSILIFNVCEKCNSSVLSFGADRRHLQNYKIV